jgi:hypothetical protein
VRLANSFGVGLGLVAIFLLSDKRLIAREDKESAKRDQQ